jgi:hypothetical protein
MATQRLQSSFVRRSMRDSPWFAIGMLVLSFGAGAVAMIAFGWQHDTSDVQLEVARTRGQLLDARQHLEEESLNRQRLEREVAELQSRVERLLTSAPPSPSVSDLADEAVEATALLEGARGLDPDDSTPGFRLEALVDLGVHPVDAERLRELWSDVEMSKLELGVLAASEGWANSHRHNEALRDLDASVREELDDTAYDQYLYASRRPNRMVVRDVIEGSVAWEAGVRPGDAILRYEGERIFSDRELNLAISQGVIGENVRLEIRRGDSERSFVVPREPLGVLSALTLDPPLR